jgi:ribosomal protein S18 acetylase RimI-like enzyme
MKIRPATLQDTDAIARLHIETWRAAYDGLMPDELLDSLSEAGRQIQWREIVKDPMPRSALYVAEQAGELVGFCHGGPARDDDLQQMDAGEIYALYVDPDHWRAGIGSELLRRLVDFFGDQEEYDFMSLWVLESNERARDFYEVAGFIPDHTEKTEEKMGFELQEVRYRSPL